MGLREALIAANDAALLDPHDAHARVIDDRAQLAQGQVEPTHGGRLGGMRGRRSSFMVRRRGSRSGAILNVARV